MKNRIAPYTAFVLAALLAACGPSEDDSADSVERQISDARDATREASENLYAYSYEEKDRFVESMEREIADLNRALDELSEKIKEAGEDVREDAEPKLGALRAKADEMKVQLERVRNASASTWESTKDGFRNAYEDLKDAFNEARNWIADKIHE